MKDFKDRARGIMRMMAGAAAEYEEALKAGDYKGAYLSAEEFSAGLWALTFTLTEWERARGGTLNAPGGRQP